MLIFFKLLAILLVGALWAFLAYTTWFGLLWGVSPVVMVPLYVLGLVVSMVVDYFVYATKR